MHSKYQKYSKNRDLNIAFAVFLAGLSCFGLLYYYQSLLPDLAHYFKISKAESSLVISSGTFGMAIGLFVAMFVADRFSRKYIIGFALLGSAVLAYISAYSENFHVLVAINFAKGFLLSGSTSVSLTYVSEEVSDARKLKITGYYIAGNAIGGMMGRVLAANIAHQYSWQAASETIGIMCFIFAVLFFVFTPKSRNFKPKKESFRTLIKPNLSLIFNKNLLPYYFTGFLLLGSFVSLYNYMAFFLIKEPFDIPKFWMPYVYVLFLVGVIGSTTVAYLGKIFGNAYHVLKAMSITGIIGITCLFLEKTAFVILGVSIFTYAFFAAHTVCSKLVGQYSKNKKSVAIAIYLLLYYIGSSVLGSSTGIVLSYFGWSIFLLSLMFFLLIIFVIFYFFKPLK